MSQAPSQPPPQPVSLRALRKGQYARVATITAEAEIGQRIRDMGLIPGVRIEIVGRAPLRDPVAVRLMGFTLMLRNNEADHIAVIPENTAENTAENTMDTAR